MAGFISLTTSRELVFEPAHGMFSIPAEKRASPVSPDVSAPAFEYPCPMSIDSFGTETLDNRDLCTRRLTAFPSLGAFIALDDIPQKQLDCMPQTIFIKCNDAFFSTDCLSLYRLVLPNIE